MQKPWTSLLIIGLPLVVTGCLAFWLILSAPADLPLWRYDTVVNGRMAAGLLVLCVFAWSLVRALSRIADRLLD